MAMLPSFKNAHAFGQVGPLAAVLVFVTVAITIVIGVRVFSDVEETINLPAGQANNTATNVINQSYSAFELASVILIVIVASVILAVLIGFGRAA
jgi:NADH:ubiquinone oxidoreductase subunit 6 (subunit J)